MQHLISITGGAGAYETSIYRLTDHGISKIFCSPDYENDETNWLSADPYFYLFMPVDADGDGIYEGYKNYPQ